MNSGMLLAIVAVSSSVGISTPRVSEARQLESTNTPRKLTILSGATDDVAAQARSQASGSDTDRSMSREQVSAAIADKLGLELIAITLANVQSLPVDAGTRGLLIAAVDRTSDAGRKGLRPDDVIIAANYRNVTTIRSLLSQIEAAEAAGRRAVLLRVKRKAQPPRLMAVFLRTPAQARAIREE